MAEQFSSSVEFGLRLSKRIFYGRGSFSAPTPEPALSRTTDVYLPTAPMCYAVIPEPEIVDNPDIRTYQPYVHGRCEPPALIPLHMHGVAMEIECSLDTAFVTVSGTWRVHCVRSSKMCDCQIAIPMGEQGSLLGLEVDDSGISYRTEVITPNDERDIEKAAKSKDGYFLKSQIYTVKFPQVSGGSLLSIKIRWCQKLLYHDDQFSVSVPFSFPSYVAPVEKKSSKKERIFLKVHSGLAAEVLCIGSSHPVKELTHQFGKLSFSYEAEVPAWSTTDFSFSYAVSSANISGGVLLQSPFLRDFDQREIFCLHLYPGSSQNRKTFRRDVVFVVDISGSMKGSPLENAKNALLASLSQLNAQDTFNIIAFNEDFYLFSPSTEPATEGAILNATQWIGTMFNAKGLYCNHYFLQMLAQIGRGHCDAAHDLDSIDSRMQRLFRSASTIIASNIMVESLEGLDSLELFPSYIPDISLEIPLIISGRYDGTMPDSIKVKGTLADMSNFEVDLKVRRAKDMQLTNVLAKRHINFVTAQAWLLESKELEEKVSKMSTQNKVPSEYTYTVLVNAEKRKKAPEPLLMKAYSKITLQNVELENQRIFLGGLSIGFGDIKATAANTPPALKEAKPSGGLLEKAASTCCSKFADACCCMCMLRSCSYMNDQVSIVCTQLCAALACFELIKCCIELCDCDCFE